MLIWLRTSPPSSRAHANGLDSHSRMCGPQPWALVYLCISVGGWHLFGSVLPIKDLLIWGLESCLWLST